MNHKTRTIAALLALGYGACFDSVSIDATRHDGEPQDSINVNHDRILPFSSFEEAEARLQEYARQAEDEQAWLTDRTLWYDIGGISTKHSNEIDEEVLRDAFSSTLQSPLFFYHQHGIITIDESIVLNPPSVADIISNILINLKSAEYKKTVVSRVAEVHGTWEFLVEDRLDIFPAGADPVLEAMMPTGDAMHDLQQRLFDWKTRYRNEAPQDQAKHILQEYGKIAGISIRFMGKKDP
ncbi:hypothetical protein HYU19_03425 [Candidatus Woesearchaeota archaeon]|nr:hypothetical protein [Candidatus Woesearchaeota archaeon]